MTTLTESTIRSYTSDQSFERGREYYHSGAIYNAIRQGNTLLADCVGTETYHLRVELDDGGLQSATCTCPYGLGDYCKHLVALLLTYIHKPGEFIERKPISALLENVDKATLVAILTKLSDRQPELYNWLETNLPVAGIAVKKSDSQPRPVSQVSEPASNSEFEKERAFAGSDTCTHRRCGVTKSEDILYMTNCKQSRPACNSSIKP